jgi:hypothetical protein
MRGMLNSANPRPLRLQPILCPLFQCSFGTLCRSGGRIPGSHVAGALAHSRPATHFRGRVSRFLRHFFFRLGCRGTSKVSCRVCLAENFVVLARPQRIFSAFISVLLSGFRQGPSTWSRQTLGLAQSIPLAEQP